MVSVLVAPDKFKGSLSADEVARSPNRRPLPFRPDLTDLTDQDCEQDSALSARLLAQCGRTLADRWIGRGGTEAGR